MADLIWLKGLQFHDSDGDPLSSGTINIYDAGTTSERTVYQDDGEGTAWTQPITLDSAGKLTASVYVPSGDWKFILKNSAASTITTEDNIPGAAAAVESFSSPQEPVLTKAASYTVETTDIGKLIVADPTSASVTLSLPAAGLVSSGRGISVLHNGTANSVIIDPDGSETVNGAATLTLTGKPSFAQIISDGSSAWYAKNPLGGGQLTGALDWATAVDLASASSIDIGAQASNLIRITGTTAITALGTAPAGEYRWLRFAGALVFTYNGTSLILPQGRSVLTAAGDVALMVSEGSGNWRCYTYTKTATDTARFPAGHLFGLTLSNNATDATNDIDIAAGSTIDGTSVENMVLGSALTKRLDATWAVGTGNGGLDTGSIANATYHIWLIKRSDTGVVDALFSTSASSPTMPTNYDYKRRIGSIIRSGGAIVAFVQRGDTFIRDVVSVQNNTSPGTSAVTITLVVPTGIVVDALITVSLESGANNALTHVLVTSLDQTDTTPSSSAYDLRLRDDNASTTSGGSGSDMIRKTNTSGQVRFRQDTATTDVYIATRGWMDTRGRLA